LDGYVDHLEFRPSPALFRHFIEQVRDLTGSVYGRRPPRRREVVFLRAPLRTVFVPRLGRKPNRPWSY
jgi:hypothetical protein